MSQAGSPQLCAEVGRIIELMKGSGVCVEGYLPLPLPDKHESPSWLDSPTLLFAQRKTSLRVKVVPSKCGAGSRLRPWSGVHSRAVTSKGIPGPDHLGQTSLLVSGHMEAPAF